VDEEDRMKRRIRWLQVAALWGSVLALTTSWGCGDGTLEVDDDTDPGDDDAGDDDTGDDDTGDDDTAAPFDCENLPPVPPPFELLPGFTGAEDFAFDGEGWVVSVNNQGNLVRHTFDGEMEVIKPNLTSEAAGTEILPGGDFVICDVAHGSLVRVTPEGGTTTLMSGLSYPNGIEVGLDGYVYVSEHNAGRVRRVDPDTGDYTIISEGLTNPNGLAFNPTHDTLYVNSFGGGTVHAIENTGGDAWTTSLYGEMPTGASSDSCAGLSAGDECFLNWGIGACADQGGDLVCVEHLDEAACAGLAQGDPCVTSALGEAIDGVCATVQGTLFCPKVPGEVVEACFGQASGDSCTALGITSDCDPSWEGVMICDITSWETVVIEACDGLDVGDPCIVIEYEGYSAGDCETGQGGALQCDVEWGGSWDDAGWLDGLNVDVCGNVYVTEYVSGGAIWRFSEPGGTPELVVETGSSWIPNMKWGYGQGGWETDVMYVMDRDSGGIFAVELGIPGKPTAFTP